MSASVESKVVGCGRPPTVRSRHGSCRFPASRFPPRLPPGVIVGQDRGSSASVAPGHMLQATDGSAIGATSGSASVWPGTQSGGVNPPIQPVEEPPHLCLAIEGPPSAPHGIDPLNHLPPRQGCLPAREGSPLLLAPLHKLLSGDGLEVARVSPASALMRRQSDGLGPASPCRPSTRSRG